jgi:hypothetical protein
MRDSLFKVIKELEGFDDAARVKEAGMLQDELREAMGMVAAIRSTAAQAAVATHGLVGAADLADTSRHTLLTLVNGVGV